MKFYSIRVAFVLQVVWMIMMSSCEKNQNVYSQPTDIPDNPSSVDVLSDKYASREITLELKENVPNSDGCIYFSFTSGKISGKSTSDAADSREWDIAFDKVNGFTNGERKGNASVSVYVTATLYSRLIYDWCNIIYFHLIFCQSICKCFEDSLSIPRITTTF